MSEPNPIERAIAAAGSQAELARKINAFPQQVNEWRVDKRPIPPDRCPAIEAATGIPCEILRSDVEWHTLPDGRKVAVGPKREAA